MEIDSTPSDYSSINIIPVAATATVAGTTNIDIIPSIDICTTDSIEAMDSDSTTTVGESSAYIDDQCAVDRPFNMNERVVTVLDQLDTRVEKLRKEAMSLQEKRDFLLMSIDLIKHNEILQNMNEYEREEITCYIHRVSSRLSTIELNVKTVRDHDQQESLCQVNTMIDSLITSNDPVMARQRCQTFLNACSGSDTNLYGSGDVGDDNSSSSMSQGATSLSGGGLFHDKKFENALLGCTLDDQKNIKRRLLALMDYLNRQTISD